MSTLGAMASPLVWGMSFHLLIGNALLGALQGGVLAVVFKLRSVWVGVVMIAAAYLSMVASVLITQAVGDAMAPWLLGDAPLWHISRFVTATAAIAFLISMLIQWPIVLACFWRRPRRVRNSIEAGLLCQALVCLLLVPYYFATSTRMGRSIKLAELRDVVADSATTVLFLSPTEGNVHRVALDGSAPVRVHDAAARDPTAVLHLREGAAGRCDLWISTRDRAEVLMPDVAPQRGARNAAPDGGFLSLWHEVVDLRPDDERPWDVHTMPTAAGGLRAQHILTDWKVQVALETPFLQWLARRATVLKGDQVIFEFGGQIVLLDLNTRKLALVAAGRSPVVLSSPSE